MLFPNISWINLILFPLLASTPLFNVSGVYMEKWDKTLYYEKCYLKRIAK